MYPVRLLHASSMSIASHMWFLNYRTHRNFRGGLIFVLFSGEVDPRKLMRTKMKNYGPSP